MSYRRTPLLEFVLVRAKDLPMVNNKASLPAFVTLNDTYHADVSGLPQSFTLLAHIKTLNLPVTPTVCITHQSFLEFISNSGLLSAWALLHSTNPQALPVALSSFIKKFNNTPIPSKWFDSWERVYKFYLNETWVSISCPTHPHVLTGLLSKKVPVRRGESVVAQTIKAAWLLLLKELSQRTSTNLFNSLSLEIPTLMVQSLVVPDFSGRIDSTKSTSKKYYALSAYPGLLPSRQSLAPSAPDNYIIDYATSQLVSTHLPLRTSYSTINQYGHLVVKKLVSKRTTSPLVSQSNLDALFTATKKIESALQQPISLEFYSVKNKIFFTHLRLFDAAINSPAIKPQPSINKDFPVATPAIANGIPASPGTATGTLRVITKLKDCKNIKSSDILYLPTASLAFVPFISGCAGVITRTGGLTSHLAVIAREMSLPLVVNIPELPVKSGSAIILDGTGGKVFASSKHAILPEVVPVSSTRSLYPTATKIYLNTSDINRNTSYDTLSQLAGVGQLRGRNILSTFGKHPKAFSSHDRDTFAKLLHTTVFNVCHFYANKPIYYVPIDLNSQDYVQLSTSTEALQPDSNPLFGYRGVTRLLNDPMLFDLELSTIFKLRSEFNCTNLHLVAPFIRSTLEFLHYKRACLKANPVTHSTLQFLALIETPAMANAIPDLIKAGADGFIVNLDHLVPLYLGIDPLSHELQEHIDPTTNECLKLISNTVRFASSASMSLIITGQLLNRHLDLLPVLLEAGLTGVTTEVSYLHALNAALYHAEGRRFTSKDI